MTTTTSTSPRSSSDAGRLVAPGLNLEVRGAVVHVRWTTRADGDFHLDTVDPVTLEARRRSIVAAAWSQPDEVHGTVARVVSAPGEHDRAEADALVTRCDGAVLGIWVGDCAPVALVGDDGSIAAVHAGWRGAAAGVLAAAVAVMRDGGARSVRGFLGPCIHPCCYEFGDHDLAALVARFGAEVEGRTRDGRRALDMPALVRRGLVAAGVTEVDDLSACTGCHGETWFSHRVRGERGRQIMAVWRTSTGAR